VYPFVEWSVEKFGEATNFENISAEQLNSKLRKFYPEAMPQSSQQYQKKIFQIYSFSSKQTLTRFGK
jgi:hypothetical protein